MAKFGQGGREYATNRSRTQVGQEWQPLNCRRCRKKRVAPSEQQCLDCWAEHISLSGWDREAKRGLLDGLATNRPGEISIVLWRSSVRAPAILSGENTQSGKPTIFEKCYSWRIRLAESSPTFRGT